MTTRVRVSARMLDGRTADVSAQRVAPNLVTHRPVDRRLSYVELTQESSGKRLGRFLRGANATAYALEALQAVPGLATGADLSDDQQRTLRALLDRHGGHPYAPREATQLDE